MSPTLLHRLRKQEWLWGPHLRGSFRAIDAMHVFRNSLNRKWPERKS